MVFRQKRDGLVDENRINNEQKEKQQKVYTPCGSVGGGGGGGGVRVDVNDEELKLL